MIEKTLMIIKPDGIKRGVVGEIISKLEKNGAKIVYLKMKWPKADKIKGNYPGTEKWMSNMGNKTIKSVDDDKHVIEKFGTIDSLKIGKKIFESLVTYLASTPMIFIVWEGHRIVDRVRRITGDTVPIDAHLGSIRGDYGFDTPIYAVSEGRIVFENLVHTSDSLEEAKREIEYWLGNDFQFASYKRDHEK